MNLNQPLPKPKMCVGDVEKFLAKVRRTQQNAVNYWNEMSVNDRLKWTALTSVSFLKDLCFICLRHSM